MSLCYGTQDGRCTDRTGSATLFLANMQGSVCPSRISRCCSWPCRLAASEIDIQNPSHPVQASRCKPVENGARWGFRDPHNCKSFPTLHHDIRPPR